MFYGLCKGKPTPKTAENKVQETLHFRYLKLLVKDWFDKRPHHPSNGALIQVPKVTASLPLKNGAWEKKIRCHF